MLKIRLKRVGRKHDPSFRIVVTEKHRGPKSGKYIENLGHYDPRRDIREVKGDRVKYWIGVGAQVSDTVHNILVTEKVLDGKKKNVLPKKSPVAKQQAQTDPPSPKATEGRGADSTRTNAEGGEEKEAPKDEDTAPEPEVKEEVPKEETTPEVKKEKAEEKTEDPKKETLEQEKPAEEPTLGPDVAVEEEKPTEEAKPEEEPKKE